MFDKKKYQKILEKKESKNFRKKKNQKMSEKNKKISKKKFKNFCQKKSKKICIFHHFPVNNFRLVNYPKNPEKKWVKKMNELNFQLAHFPPITALHSTHTFSNPPTKSHFLKNHKKTSKNTKKKTKNLKRKINLHKIFFFYFFVYFPHFVCFYF